MRALAATGMRRFALVAVLALAACAEYQSYLNRWDDPRVIQVRLPYWHEHCQVQQTRPSPVALSAIAALERKDGPPPCPWIDGLVHFDRRAESVQVLPRPRPEGPSWRCVLSARMIACPQMTPVQSAAEAIRALTPAGVAQADLCLAMHFDQSLAVSEVFAMRNQLLTEGVNCLMVIQELAITAEGGRFPKRT